MQNIQQFITGATSMASSASSVANALGRPSARSAASAQVAGSSTGSAESTSSTVTAKDFLTLLVAEMKNQDPTQPSDPNAYISQMVNVNSLQQLIGINQGVASLEAANVPASTGSK